MTSSGIRCYLASAGAGVAMLTLFGLVGCQVIPDAEKHAPASLQPENEVLATAAQANAPGVIMVKSFGVSMLPAYREGTIFLIEPVKWEDLNAGDVIAYKNSLGQVIVHRLIHSYGDSWLVQGDNNAEPDREVVTRQNLVGVMYASLLPGTEVENNQ